MAVTRSRSAERAVERVAMRRAGWRTRELVAMLASAALVAGGLYVVHKAKAVSLPEVEAGLASKRLLNLNGLGTREDLLPALAPLFPKQHDRDEAARQIYYLNGTLPNTGAIMRTKLLTAEQFRQLKPLFVVRRPAAFERAFLLWSGLFFAAFLLLHVYWSVRGFGGDQLFLPAILLLTGIGLI